MKRILTYVAILLGLASCSIFVKAPEFYVVFFSASSTELSPEAHATVDQAARAIRETHPASVTLGAGIASGDNLKLAAPRFEAVRQALVADGVASDLIARSAIPDSNLNTGGVGDQCVEIRLIPTHTP